MMNTKDNQRTRISKMMLKEAMLDLLAEKGSVDKISVRELCEVADLNRSTFYSHYSEPEALLAEMEEELLEGARQHLEKIGKSSLNGAENYLLSLLRYIKKHDREYRILLVDADSSDFRNRFQHIATGEFIASFDLTFKSEEEQFVYSYILNGSTSVIIQWIRSGYTLDESTLVSLLFTLNKNLLAGGVLLE